MATIFYLNYDPDKLLAETAPLVASGHRVRGYDNTKVAPPRFRDKAPEVVIVSLEKNRDKGLTFAEGFFATKRNHRVPFLFVGVSGEDLDDLRERFPQTLVLQDPGDAPRVLEEILGSLRSGSASASNPMAWH